MPFQDPVEMGMTIDQVVNTVAAQTYYPELFQAAFGSEEVTAEKISLALAQFVRSIFSVDSKYDEGRPQVNIPTNDFPNYTASENNGDPVRLNLTDQEKADLVNFLKTLTDETITGDVRFSDPFQ